MSTERDVTRVVRSWLREDAREDASRILDSVLDQLDDIPQRRPWWPVRRFLEMKPLTRFAVAAAMLLVVALIGIGLFTGRNVAAPRMVTEPTPTPKSFALVASGPLEPGAYTVDQRFPVVLTFTIPEGWDKWIADSGAVMVMKPGTEPWSASLQFWIVSEVYTDPCQSSLGAVDPGPSVEDLAAALASQPGADATVPTDVVLAGVAGMFVEASVPSEIGDCERGEFAQWTSPSQWDAIAQEDHANLLLRLWVLDVDGVRVLISAAHYPSTPPEHVAGLNAMVESVQMSPREPAD